MRLNHTPLGRARSNKKLIAGVAALALVGGITPALILNTHAEEMIYTTVGPDFYTITKDALNYSDVSRIYIEDTSVADFYDESWDCSEEYSCIQGKKTGETEIVVERTDNETLYLPLKSVKLNTNKYYVQDNRTTIERTATLTGAGNSLLSIYEVEDDEAGDATLEQTGTASYRISSNNIENENTFDITWKIGEQIVGGGTEIVLRPIEAHDKISHNSENEKILREAVVSLIEANEDVTSLSYNGTISDEAGNVAYGRKYTDSELRDFLNNVRTGAPYGVGAIMDISEYDPKTDNREEEVYKMVFGDKEVSGVHYMTAYIGIGNCVNLVSGADYLKRDDYEDMYTSIASYDEESGRVCMNAARVEKLAKPLTYTLKTDDVEPVKEGFKRTWYVYLPDYTIAPGPDVDHAFNVVDSVYDEENNTLSFKSEYPAEFAYAYVDSEIEAEPEEGPEEKPKDDTPAVPNTGIAPTKVVSTAVTTFLPLMAIIGFAFIVRNKKKASNKLAKKHNHFE